MTKLFDNIDLNLGDQLLETFAGSERMDAAVGYFNLRGWGGLARALDERSAGEEPIVRVLVGMTVGDQHDRVLRSLQAEIDQNSGEPDIDNSEARRRRDLAIHRFRMQLMRGLPSEVDLRDLRRMRAHLADGRLRIALFTRKPMHAKTYICHRDEAIAPIVGYVGSSNLTLAGLENNFELNVDVIDNDAAVKLAEWFQDRWDDRFTIDITDDLIKLIDESWAAEQPVDPYLVFLKVCYLVSQEARDGLAEYELPALVRDQLLAFQASAVKTLTRRISKRRGAMLGDVVGLGKTITAVAVALMLREEQGFTTLVVCPKNLVKMWEAYFEHYEVVGKVVPYSMADKELPELRRHQLVIIDESHTLRSDTRIDYRAIHDYIRDNDSRVLLLTATPYNKQYLDVANQLSLFVDEDENLGLAPVEAIRKNPKLVQAVDGKVTTLGAFRRSEEPEDWRRLMSEHLVRRTRGFVRQNFSEVDPENGREFLTFSDGSRFYFPERIAKPLIHEFGVDDPGRAMVEDSTLDAINGLKLPRYALGRYVLKTRRDDADLAHVIEDLERASGHLLGFTRTSLFKRLSSCGHAFLVSLRRHQARNEMYLYALRSGLDLPVGTLSEAWVDVDEDLIDEDGPTPEQQYDALRARNPKQVTWIPADAFNKDLEKDLETDVKTVGFLLEEFGEWDQALDSKIDALVDLIEHEHGGEKVLIFSEFKDSVDYIVDALEARGVTSVAGVSGDTGDPSSVVKRFAPRSNQQVLGKSGKKVTDELRVLVTTDVLSEGQNLQDSHIVVMYDLPWAIIRLIQRAGRVDRVGQEASEVLIYSFTAEDVETVLSLRHRIRERLQANAAVFGSDEAFFGTPEETKVIGDFYNGKVPDEEDGGEVDAASYALQAWNRAEEEHPDLAERARALPDMVFSTKAVTAEQPDGVLAYVRTQAGFDAFGLANGADEPGLLTALEALRLLNCTPDTPPSEKITDHFDRVRLLVRGPLQRPRLVAGRLWGTRLRVWKRLNGSLDAANPDVERALEALYDAPLRAEAEGRLRSFLRDRPNSDLAQLIAVLHRDGALVVSREDLDDPLHLVCSVGLVGP